MIAYRHSLDCDTHDAIALLLVFCEIIDSVMERASVSTSYCFLLTRGSQWVMIDPAFIMTMLE